MLDDCGFEPKSTFQVSPMESLNRAITRVEQDKEKYTSAMTLLVKDKNFGNFEWHHSNLSNYQTFVLLSSYIYNLRNYIEGKSLTLLFDDVIHAIGRLVGVLERSPEIDPFDNYKVRKEND